MTTIRRGPRPHRRDSLIKELRGQIMRGDLKPGSRLPSQRHLTRQFNTALPTLHGAVQCLIRDGFVETQGTRGTFVAQTPPHLCAYGLVFPRLFIETRFFRALRAAARVVFDSESRRSRQYEVNVNNPADPVNLRLLDDVAHHRLAGVILTWPSGGFAGSALYGRDCDVPRVVLGGYSIAEGVPGLALDSTAFYERAVDRLIARGRGKIAHLGIGEEHSPDPLADILRRRGLEHRPYWHLQLGIMRFATAQAAAHLLMSLSPADRPDGLIISDDNLTEHAQAGLVAAGVKMPQDLDVITHCNWPQPPAAVLPLTRLGFDGIGLVRACTQLIDQQRRGETVPRAIPVGPFFEEELPAGSVDAGAVVAPIDPRFEEKLSTAAAEADSARGARSNS